jgi:hypothetical protein
VGSGLRRKDGEGDFGCGRRMGWEWRQNEKPVSTSMPIRMTDRMNPGLAEVLQG